MYYRNRPPGSARQLSLSFGSRRWMDNTCRRESSLTPEEKDNCRRAIEKTGFVLERKVSGILEKNRWNVINNRYYVDDVTGTQREIDVLAYKWCLIENITVVTTLLISCKKSEESAWVFLTRPVNVSDPNFDRSEERRGGKGCRSRG